MAKKTFDLIEQLATKTPTRLPPIDEEAYKRYIERYGQNIGTDLPELSGYDFRSAFRTGLRPKNWLDLPEEARYEDIAQALSGIYRFPAEETQFLRRLAPGDFLHPGVYKIFDMYMRTRPPVYYWPDVFKLK